MYHTLQLCGSYSSSFNCLCLFSLVKLLILIVVNFYTESSCYNLRYLKNIMRLPRQLTCLDIFSLRLCFFLSILTATCCVFSMNEIKNIGQLIYTKLLNKFKKKENFLFYMSLLSIIMFL